MRAGLSPRTGGLVILGDDLHPDLFFDSSPPLSLTSVISLCARVDCTGQLQKLRGGG